MLADLPYDTNLIATVADTITIIVDHVVAKTLPMPTLVSTKSSIATTNIEDIVDETISDISGEFCNLQSQLIDFLRVISHQTITPGSPSSSSDINEWNDLSRWPDIKPRKQQNKSHVKSSLAVCDDVKRESEIFHESGSESNSRSKIGDSVRQELVRRPESTQLTVEVFRRAFETGNFSEVEAIMSSYSIESQFSRDSYLEMEQPIRVRRQRDAVKPLESQRLFVPLPSMMMTRNRAEYIPDQLPSSAAAAQMLRSCTVNSLILCRSDHSCPSQSASQQKQRLLELQVIKHGRHGKPKFKRLSVDTSLGVISWGTGSILMVDIKQIRCGRQTYVLNRKHAAQAYEGLFASIITPNRTLDLEMRSRTERNEIVAQIQQLIAEYLKMEKNQHVVWNRHEIDNSDVDHQVIVSNMTTYRPSRVSSWKSALLKFLFRRGSMASWTTERL